MSLTSSMPIHLRFLARYGSWMMNDIGYPFRVACRTCLRCFRDSTESHRKVDHTLTTKLWPRKLCRGDQARATSGPLRCMSAYKMLSSTSERGSWSRQSITGCSQCAGHYGGYLNNCLFKFFCFTLFNYIMHLLPFEDCRQRRQIWGSQAPQYTNHANHRLMTAWCHWPHPCLYVSDSFPAVANGWWTTSAPLCVSPAAHASGASETAPNHTERWTIHCQQSYGQGNTETHSLLAIQIPPPFLISSG